MRSTRVPYAAARLVLLLTAFLTALPPLARAQETGAIVIRVTDSNNGAPVDNAQVFLLGQDTPQSSLTNAQGILIFDVLPGSYRLIVKASSYNDSGSIDVNVDEGQRVQVSVKLQLREIAHVVSHGSGTSTVTIDDSSAQRKVSQTLSDALNKIAGVTVDTVDYGANSAFNISLHGNDASRTGYSIDGMRLNGPAAQAVGGLQDLFSGSSIDFSPNAASAGGTVNFYTLQPSKLWTYHATGAVGNYSNTLGTFAFTGGSGHFSFAFERSAGGQDEPLDGKYYADTSGQSYVHTGGGARVADLEKVSVALSPVSTLRYTAMSGSGNSQYICSADTTLLPCGSGPGSGNHNSNIFQTFAFGSLAGHVQYNVFTNLGDYRYNGSEPDRSINGMLIPYTSSGKFPFQNEGLYLSTSARRHTISGGAYFTSSSSSFTSSYNGVQTLTGTRTTRFQNIWLSDRIKANDKFALTHGLSQAAGTGTGSSLVFSETATWQPATADTFELQGSLGSSYPSAQFTAPMSDPASADMDCFNKSTFVQGPADEPVHQSSSTYDFGYKHTWKRGFVHLDAYRNNSFGDSMQVAVPFAAEPAALFPNGPAAYLNQLQQIWAQPTVCGSMPFDPRGVYVDQLATGLGQVSQGVTFSAQYALGRNVVLFPSYAATSAYISNADPRLTAPGGLFLPFAQLPHHPLHTAGLILDGILPRQSLEWIADAQFTSADNPQNLPAYTVYNGGLVFHGQYGSLQLLLSNVFDTHTGLFTTYQGVNPTPIAGGGTFAYATTPLPPRGITLQYDVRWKQHTSPPKAAASAAPKPKTTLVAAAAAFATPSPEDTANIALSETIAARVGDRVWPDWSKTPFYIDLLTGHGPALVGFTEASPPPTFPPILEATFPLYPGKPTIVIGEPQFTLAKTPIRWSVTLLHEHFHQWQYNWPPYYRDVTALGLAPKGDNGMWMLNYPFPYSDPATGNRYHLLARALHDAVVAIGQPSFAARVQRYTTLRAAFRNSLKPDYYKYFAFQCWQEGTARYTEIAVTRAAAAEHDRDASFLTNSQAQALSDDGAGTYKRIVDELANASLADRKRVNFYAFGAGEALLLDALKPGWHAQYLDPRMDLSAFF